MNYGRLAITAVVAAVVDMVYGYAVYGMGMAGQFAAASGVFRPMEAVNGRIWLMVLGTLVGMLAAVYIYAKGYEDGSGAQEGLRFGILVGVLMTGYVLVGDYVTMNIGRRLAVSLAIGTLVEWVVVGVTIGLVYKPAASAGASRRTPGV